MKPLFCTYRVDTEVVITSGQTDKKNPRSLRSIPQGTRFIILFSLQLLL